MHAIEIIFSVADMHTYIYFFASFKKIKCEKKLDLNPFLLYKNRIGMGNKFPANI